MKKNGLFCLLWGGWSKQLLKMKLLVLLCFVMGMQLSAKVYSQNERVSLSFENAMLSEVIEQIEKVSETTFLYQDRDVIGIEGISFECNNEKLGVVLKKCLEETPLTYSFLDNTVVLTRKKEIVRKKDVFQDKLIISGFVYDSDKKPLPGVYVSIKGKNEGVTTDINGKYVIAVEPKTVLIFSFIGMKSKEVKVKSKTKIDVVLLDDVEEIEELVVTGYSSISKKNFTGNVVSVSKEDLLKVSKSNVISALQSFDPSFRIQENSQLGSDPNALPEIYIRGRSGIGTKDLDRSSLDKSNLKDNPNLPIFIMDGFQISVQKLYDFDLTRIESLTILKDAASTAIYGSRAANGVVVITTVKPKAGELSVSYNFTGSIQMPDLSDYNLMNARELLNAEKTAGFYEGNELPDERLLKEYSKKYNNIVQGVDTYWLSKPLRVALNSKHSVFVEGGAEDVRFGIDFNSNNANGVMKESFRNTIGGGIYIDFKINKLQVRNYVSYNIVNSQDSPYGQFNDYATALPYDKFEDENGKYLKNLPGWHSSLKRINPLYESTLQNFSGSSYEELISNTSLNYYLNSSLHIKGQVGVTKQISKREYFIDPLSNRNANRLNLDNMSSGTYQLTDGKSFNLNANFLLNYNKSINNHNVNLVLGCNAVSNSNEDIRSEYRGFPSGTLNSINYAEEIYQKPTVSEKTSRLFGLFSSLNYTYDEIYLFDASYRLDGSSEFGRDNKFAPFWASGLGLNLHNYDFLQDNPVVNLLKVRASYGLSGKVNFPAYVASTTYNILTDEWYKTGFGTSLKALGNENLTWEKTNTLDIGLETSLFENFLYVKGSYYRKKTTDLINTVTVPTSSGFSQYYDNMGEVMNKGYEMIMRLNLINTKKMNFAFNVNLAHNENEILGISESLKAYNDKVDKYYKDLQGDDKASSKPIMKYRPGGSLTSIYGMKSLGIDPATGREIFLKRNGDITSIWDPSEQVVVGNYEPFAQGSFGFNLRYNSLSIYSTFTYKFGGDAYNSTLVSKIENARLYEENVDKRVFSDRWKNPGDQSMYKSIRDQSGITRPTSRFVQEDNVLTFSSLTLGYDFSGELLKRAHLNMLRFELGMNDIFRISSVKQERGTGYPFARQVSLSLKAMF